MKLGVSILFFVTFAACDPAIIYLKKYRDPSTIFDNIESGAQLYLASNDDNDALKNIHVTTGALSVSLDILNKINADGSPMSLTITNGLTLTTTNSETVTKVLTGFLYVTNKAQADDPTFSVMVIKNRHIITTPRGQNSTVVILNTELMSDSIDADKPDKTSYVTEINQLSDTDLHFHWGIPASNWTKVTVNQFFENPLYLDYIDMKTKKIVNTTVAFFDNIDPLPVNVDYWYLTTTGQVSMVVENKYVSYHEYTTNSVNSTGLISNSFVFKQQRVNFLLDYTRTRTVGTLISVWPESTDYITFILGNGETEIDQNFNINSTVKHALLTTQFQASYLIVRSTTYLPGMFFCQYYGITGDLVPVNTTTLGPSTVSQSTTVPSSTVSVMTTTKSSWTIRVFEMFVMVFVVMLIS